MHENAIMASIKIRKACGGGDSGRRMSGESESESRNSSARRAWQRMNVCETRGDWWPVSWNLISSLEIQEIQEAFSNHHKADVTRKCRKCRYGTADQPK